MKENIEHFLFENVWNVVREIVPEEVPIKSIFSIQEIRAQKFEDLFPEVVLSTVAIISNKLAEQGLILPLNNLCNMPLGEVLQKSVYLSTYDLSTVPDNFISAHLVKGVVPMIEELDETIDEVAFKPLKWPEASVVSDSESFYQKVEKLKQEHPDSFIFAQYQPWKKMIDKSTNIPKNDLVYNNAQRIFKDFMKNVGSAFEADFDQIFSANMNEYKAQFMQEAFKKSPGELGVGINKGVTIYANLEPFDFGNDYSVEDVEEVLNINMLCANTSWIADTTDLVMQAVATKEPDQYYGIGYNAKLNGDFFIFPNSEDIMSLNLNEPFHIIALNRLDESDLSSLLASVLNR
jgi:hypothetical protein